MNKRPRVKVSTKNLQEAPQANSTENRDSEIIIPSEKIDELTSGSDETGHKAHDAQSDWAHDDGASSVSRPAKETLDDIGEKIEAALEHDAILRVIGKGSHVRHEPAPKRSGSEDTDEPGS